ncbi:hypothetical protein GQ600_2619 [Phytophthora cactorum]|nr:hypothetical protein GQ600_2619 [Phytophthora cactorum]
MVFTELTSEDLDLLSRNFTKHPRLALLYFHCCSSDPACCVFNDEKLEGAGSEATVKRLLDNLDEPLGEVTASLCQNRVLHSSGSSGDLWMCASCCETPNTVEDYRCHGDPRKSEFSIASGHDYGRPSDLPELSDVASKCIAPENNIHVDESDNTKCAVAYLENQIRNGVHYMESERAESVDASAVGDRFGEEYKENLAVPIVAKSAVLKDMDGVDLSVKNASIEAMISMLNKNAADTDEPPLVTVRRGEEPVTEWNYIG